MLGTPALVAAAAIIAGYALARRRSWAKVALVIAMVSALAAAAVVWVIVSHPQPLSKSPWGAGNVLGRLFGDMPVFDVAFAAEGTQLIRTGSGETSGSQRKRREIGTVDRKYSDCATFSIISRLWR